MDCLSRAKRFFAGHAGESNFTVCDRGGGQQMTKNTGIPYEKMIQHIYQQILNCEGLDTINVQHNIILKGKTTSHQIDVYWEFNLRGIVYRTVIQAKDG